ncbi:MAG TPA: hypothetical protein VF337_02020 [Candidatus Limnocylindrales bacterium]
MKIGLPVWLNRLAGHTDLLRAVAVVLCAASAVVYLVIGMGLIFEQRPGGMRLWLFGYSAALAFAAGAVILLARPGRGDWPGCSGRRSWFS